MTEVSIYENVKEIKKGFVLTLERALERITEGTSKDLVLKVSKLSSEESKPFKKQLPCIMFNGTFNERVNDGLVKASQFAVLDFDNTKQANKPFEAAIELREELKNDELIYSAWLSPSLKGVKALVKIPIVKDDAEFKEYYEALIIHYASLGDENKELDISNKNIARVCYESFDEGLWINDDSRLWEEKVIIKDKTPRPKPTAFNLPDDTKHPYIKKVVSNVIQTTVGMIATATDGDKHLKLIDASVLLGGYVPRYISEAEAISHLSFACEANGYSENKSYSYSRNLIDGIAMGMAKPLVVEIPLNTYVRTAPEVVEFEEVNDFSRFISKKGEGWDFIEDFHDGKVEMGIQTGVEFLDKHFQWKKNEFYTVTGGKGRGKTSIVQALSLISTVAKGWKWILSLKENNTEDAKESLFMYLAHAGYDNMRKSKPKETQMIKDFIEEHYIFLENITTIEQVLETSKYIIKNNPETTFVVFIDPANSHMAGYEFGDTQIEYSNGAKMAVKILEFSQDHCSVVLSQHTIMSAQRAGVVSSASAEGGWFTSKASYTIGIHREQGTSDNKIVVDNVRRPRTGGKETKLENSLIIIWTPYDLHIKMEKETHLTQNYLIAKVQNNSGWFNSLGAGGNREPTREVPCELALQPITPDEAFAPSDEIDNIIEVYDKKNSSYEENMDDIDTPW